MQRIDSRQDSFGIHQWKPREMQLPVRTAGDTELTAAWREMLCTNHRSIDIDSSATEDRSLNSQIFESAGLSLQESAQPIKTSDHKHFRNGPRKEGESEELEAILENIADDIFGTQYDREWQAVEQRNRASVQRF